MNYSRLATDGSWAKDEAGAALSYPHPRTSKTACSAWSVGASSAAGRRASPRPSACKSKIANRPGSPPQSGRVSLDELLAAADILSLHCPLNEATRGLIGARELALMKPDALLINTARGGLIDGAALAAALKTGGLAAPASMSCLRSRRRRASRYWTHKSPIYW